MTVYSTFSQNYLCQVLLEHCDQNDLISLVSTCQVFSSCRQWLFQNVFHLVLRQKDHFYQASLRFAPKHIDLRGRWACSIDLCNFNFYRLVTFESNCFNRKIKSFGNLSTFRCQGFNQHITLRPDQKDLFGKMADFDCDSFNKPVHSFVPLLRFKSSRFRFPVFSFDSLVSFECDQFNHPISSFGNLKNFKSAWFNQPIRGFDSLEHFSSVRFNQPIHDFGNLISFATRDFNQPINSFGNLISFASQQYNQPVSSLGQLQHFCSERFNRPIQDWGNLITFESQTFNQPVQNLGKLEIFSACSFEQPLWSFGNLRKFQCYGFQKPDISGTFCSRYYQLVRYNIFVVYRKPTQKLLHVLIFLLGLALLYTFILIGCAIWL